MEEPTGAESNCTTRWRSSQIGARPYSCRAGASRVLQSSRRLKPKPPMKTMARQAPTKDSPPGEIESLTRYQRRTCRRRREKLAVYDAAIESGATKTEAMRLARIDPVTCWRLLRARAERGPDALIPRKTTGRPNTLVSFQLSPAAIAAVQKLCVSLGGAERAWRAFATTPACPSELAAFIAARKSLPPSMLSAARPKRFAATVYRGDGFEFVVSH